MSFFLSLNLSVNAQSVKDTRRMKQIDRQCAFIYSRIDKGKPHSRKEFEDTTMNITSGVVRQYMCNKRPAVLEKQLTHDSVCLITEIFILHREKLLRYTSQETCKYFSEIIKTSDTYYFNPEKLFLHLRSINGYVKEPKSESIPIRKNENNFIITDFKWWLSFLNSESDYSHFESE
ncbi:MAG: hypothetical protein IPH78_05850 [Bacteroidetes bacterium]|nr:hypothetical protein [Bacteroidota bacterium]